MKKIISITAIMLLAICFKSSAQRLYQDIFIPPTELKEGVNNISIAQTGGSFGITKLGSRLLNLIYVDSIGKRTTLSAATSATAGAPNPECKCPMPDGCYSSPDKKIGLCICKPCDLSNGVQTYAATIRIRIAATNNRGKL